MLSEELRRRVKQNSSFMLIVICCLMIESCGKKTPVFELSVDQSDAIDSLLEIKKVAHHVPGIAIAVIKDGKVVKQITTGLANIELGTPIKANTRFQLASTTKTFAATSVLLLVQEGKITLTDRVGDVVEGLPKEWQAVTIRQLLSHTSGLPDIVRVPGKLDLIAETWERSLQIIYTAPLQFAAGEAWAYTQTNYVLLSKIIEKVSERSFEQFMEERLFKPLGMINTSYDRVDSSIVAKNYEGSQGLPRSLEFPEFVHAAGGLRSSLEDMIKWNTALDKGELLNSKLLHQMWEAQSLKDGSLFYLDGKSIGYGLGWAIDDTPGKWSAGHSGGNSTGYRRFIDENFTIIVLHNGNMDPDELIASIAKIVRNSPGDKGIIAQERFWDAAKAGDTTELLLALKDGANIEMLDTRKSKSGRRALNWAAWNNHPGAIKVLIQIGCQLNASNNTGFTALHHAAEAGSFEAAKTLLESGADPTMVNKSGNRPAETARSQNHVEVAKLIESSMAK